MESVHKYLSIAINRLAQIIRSACVSLLVGPVCFCWKITRKIDSSIYVDVKLLQIQSVIASSKCFYVRLGDTVVCNLNGSQHYWRDSSNFNASLHGRIFSVEFLTQCEISVSEYTFGSEKPLTERREQKQKDSQGKYRLTEYIYIVYQWIVSFAFTSHDTKYYFSALVM